MNGSYEKWLQTKKNRMKPRMWEELDVMENKLVKYQEEK